MSLAVLRGMQLATAMRPLPAAFYGAIDSRNPVIAAFEAELREVLRSLKRHRPPAGDLQQQAHRRGASTFLNIWTNYKPRLPAWYYYEKLLKVGDALTEIKEYKLALFQCYGRYLQQFSSVNIDELTDVYQFMSTFFPNGVEDTQAESTLHALQGRSFCIYQIVRTSDANLHNQESVKKCLSVLSLLRLNMQVVLPYEHHCWLIFNGTVHIYTVCRHLMSLGHSAKALDYLVWASVCMESSIPLLAIYYLTWRATLYTAVCQCYYDCHAGVHGEVFARRALSKIDELNQLENMTDSLHYEEAKKAFTEATTKMAVMIFKRAVYESRRKPKGVLRPKIKNMLKDAEKLQWPRTATERLLMEMFEGSAAHFLAILEALSGNNVRVLQASPSVPDEPEIHDVISELLFAGTDILLGGGSSTGAQGNIRNDPSKVISPSISLMQLAVEGRAGVSADAALKFTKLAFSYAQWDAFDAIIPSVFAFVQSQDNPTWRKEEMDLKILIAMEPLLSGRKHIHGIAVCESHVKEELCGGSITFHGESIKTGGSSDDLVVLAETMFLCVCNHVRGVLPDKDLVVDVVMFLWQKCKHGVQRIQPSGTDGSKFIQKFEANSKWVHILLLIQEVVLCCNTVDIDAVVIAEVALLLAGLFENMADSPTQTGKKSDKTKEQIDTDSSVPTQIHSISLFLKKSQSEQLFLAYETLEKAVHGMALSRSLTILQDVTSVTDYCCTKHNSGEPNLKNSGSEHHSCLKPFLINSFMMDLHLELLHTQHGVSAKLLNVLHGDGKHPTSCSSACTKGTKRCLHFFTEQYILNTINKSNVSKAIFLIQKAALVIRKGFASSCETRLIEEVLTLIQKAEAEENALYASCITHPEAGKAAKRGVPPPPILLSRTDCSMVFKPAPFAPDVKVSWYCLFGRQVTGEGSVKARLNDHHLPCTGEEIAATEEPILEVKGLKANEKYVFAVAAYSADGTLIGDAIGKSTKPILAYPPLSTLVCRAYLTQIAYQGGNFKVAKKSFSVLWDYFVSTPIGSPPGVSAGSTNNSLNFPKQRLSLDAVSHASPFLLQLFLRSIFIASDIHIKEGALFCDSLCANGILSKWQIKRITECEKLLLALELCSRMNDFNHALQAVVQCYGLLVPIIYHKIPSVPAMQILIQSLAVLQEIPSSTWQKKQTGCADSLLHMIACIVYYMAKVLRSWDEYELTKAVIDCGKRLLDSSDNTANITIHHNKVPSSEDLENASDEKTDGIQTDLPKKNVKKPPSLIVEKVNEQLAALEANLLKMAKPSTGPSLTGQEDPILLHSVVSCWPSKTAFRELMKFKKKSRFLEFFVQLLQREVYEEKFQQVLEWTVSVQDHLRRRNETLHGNKKNLENEMGEVTVSGEAFKRYTAALVEYQKNRELQAPKQTRKETLSTKQKEKDKKHQEKSIPAKKCTDLSRKQGEELEKRAFATLIVLLTPIVGSYMKRKRFRRICLEEMPWRAQMNILLAFAHFSLFQKNLVQMPNEECDPSQSKKSYSVLDPELVSLHNSGTVVIGTGKKTLNEHAWFSHSFQPSLKTDVKAGIKTVTDSDEFSEQSTKMSEMDTPRTQMTNESEMLSSRSTKEQEKQHLLNSSILDNFFKIFLHLRRAVVLAHRGGHWTLLQNVCRILWNFTLELQSITENIDSAQRETFPVTLDILIYTMSLPFYLASDMIFDMIIALQNYNSIQLIDAAGEFSVPSCFGIVADDDGGSSLIFEYPLDDVNVVDLRFMCDLVLRTIEVLYHLKRWEALVYIVMQFNIITHERYSERVTPLLVYAQRQLIIRIHQFNGPNAPQPHFIKYISNHGEKINCRNFVGKQLYVATKSKEVINPGGHIDPEGHDIYSGGKQAKALVCVPLDVNDSLKCFRESLQKSKYPSRALRHSRKLLSLFLSHIQGSDPMGRMNSQCTLPGKVEFNVGAAQTQQPIPPDLSKEEFISPIAIQNKGIPQTQLSVVILSYEKTIEILHGNNQQGLKAQALHELGNIHMYARHERAAFRCWCQALDEILMTADVLSTWQVLGGVSDVAESIVNGSVKDYSDTFLHRAGIWGCLQAAVLTTKIAQYILKSDLKMRTECCILSAFLFKALFRASLPHPRADRDYALYEIGEGCEVIELVPGIDLFSDRYRADVSTVVASLDFLMYELHCSHQNLMVLPLFTLYQYCVSMICHDPTKSIEGRILKIKVLTDLRFFAEASYELNQLNDGQKIPKSHHGGYRPFKKTKDIKKFDSSKPLLAHDNMLAMEDILNKRPSPTLTSVCDHQIMDRFALAKAHLIISLSFTINAIPEMVKRSSYSVINKSSIKHQKKTSDVQTQGSAEGKHVEPAVIVQLLSKEELTMETLKGILLSEAERSLTSIVEGIQKENSSEILECSALDLEVIVEAKLMLVAIAQQRHQTALSAALALSTIQLLKEARILKLNRFHVTSSALRQSIQLKEHTYEHDPAIDNSQLPYNEEAQSRLNIRMWLRCRLALVTSLVAQIRGVGVMKEEKILDCSALITEGVLEAETFGDIEIQAEMVLKNVLLDLQEGRPKKGIKLLLKDIINLLQERQFISPEASLILVQSMILLADILKRESEANKGHHAVDKEDLNTYIISHKLINEQFISLGETVEQRTCEPAFTSPLEPLRNIYLPHISLLAKVKLRIGNILAQEASCTLKTQKPSHWLPAHRLFATALELCRLSSTKEFDVEAEIIFQKAIVESQMFTAGDYDMLSAFWTFWNAIDLSQRNDQHFGLMRKSYLEVARLYFHLVTMVSSRTEGVTSTLGEDDAKEKVEVKQKGSKENILNPPEMYRLMAWIAIRAATQVEVAMVACKKLIEQNSATCTVNPGLQQYIPLFASMDLLNTYKDFLSEEYQMIHESITTNDEIEDQNKLTKEDDKEWKDKGHKEGESRLTLSWIHLIRYHNSLRSLISRINLATISKTVHGSRYPENILCTSIFNTGLNLRTAEMHHFLKKFMPSYSACCVDETPKELFSGLSVLSTVNARYDEKHQKMTTVKLPSNLQTSEIRVNSQNDFMTNSSSDKELCLQWYHPALERPSEDTEPMILLFYAYNTKSVKITNLMSCDVTDVFCGHVWIPLARIVSLHEKLSTVKQQAEISMRRPTVESLALQNKKQKQVPQAKSKTDFETKIQLSEKQEEILKMCCSEAKALLTSAPDVQPLIQVPFDVSLHSLNSLEEVFDPAHGGVLVGGSLFEWITSLLN